MLYPAGQVTRISGETEQPVLTRAITHPSYDAEPGVVFTGSADPADLPAYAVVAIQTSTGGVVPYVDAAPDGAGVPVGIIKSAIGFAQVPVVAGVTTMDVKLSYFTKGTFFINDAAANLLLKGYDANTVANSNGWSVSGNVLTIN